MEPKTMTVPDAGRECASRGAGQAAMAALPHEHPKLGAVATLSMNSNDFATLLERSIERSGKTAEVRQIEHQHGPAPAAQDNDELS
jgi:hypothetical protein